MPLHRIKDFDPDYRNHFEDQQILGYDLYSGNEKVGSVDDLLVDDNGKFRYLIVSTGIWIFGKKVLLPIGRAQINNNDRRVYANGLTRTQVEQLPQYQEGQSVDYEQEEQVRSVYRPSATASLDAAAPLATAAVAYNRDDYSYDHEPALYDLNEENHQNLRLYEERLVANKTRQKTGEVAIGKRVETETAKVSVPIDLSTNYQTYASNRFESLFGAGDR